MKTTVTVLSLLAASSAFAAVPTEWTFRVVAREGQTGAGFGLPTGAELVQNDPSIDSDGSVAVRYTLSGSNGLFVFDAAAGTATSYPLATSYFSGSDFLNGRIALISESEVDVLDRTATLLYSFPLGGTEGVTGAINRARLSAGGAVGYRAASGGTTKHIVDQFIAGNREQAALATTNEYTFLYSPTMNDSLQMASKADFTTGGTGVGRWQQGQAPVTIFSTVGSSYNAVSNGTDLNNAGEVAFFPRLTTGSIFELRKGSGGATTLIATGDPSNPQGISNSAFANFPPVINNNGLVAFRPNDFVGNAIFIGDGTDLVRVTGDTSSVTLPDGGQVQLGFGSPRVAVIGNIALNDANQIAFIGRLSDGTDAVIIATPVGGCGTSDFNGDGDFGTDQDIEAFFACLAGTCCATCFEGGSDFNGDGDFGTDQDIEAFFRVLGGGSC